MLLEAEGSPVPFDCAELVDALDRSFDAFRRVERFARLVLVLNWIVDSTGSPLPPLSSSVRAVRGNIPPVMKVDEVLGTP
jgi:hypothetical protein